MGRSLPGMVSACLVTGCTLTPTETRPQIVSEIESLTGFQKDLPQPNNSKPLAWWVELGGTELDQLVRTLRDQSFTLQEARLQSEQAQELALVATGVRRPSIDSSLDVESNRSLNTSGAFEWSESYNVGLSGSYSADIFGELRAAQRAAVLTAEASLLSYRAIEQQEIATLARDWVAASALKKRLNLARETAESYRVTFELSNARYRAGSENVSASDVQIARQNYDSALVDIPDLEVQLTSQLLEIDAQLARLPGETAKSFLGQPTSLRPETPPVGTPIELLSNRPDVAAAELAYRAALEDVGAARADLYPALALTASFRFQSDDLSGLFNWDDHIAGLAASLTQSVFNVGQLKSQVRLQEAVANELATTFARTALRAVIDVEQAIVNVAGQMDQLKRQRDAVSSAQLSDQIAQNRYRQGLNSLLSLLETQRSLNTARERLILIEQAELNANIDLRLSLGGAWFAPVEDTLTGKEYK